MTHAPVRSADLPPRDEDELEDRLSRPTTRVIDALAAHPGDVVVIGAGGKMGPSLTAMVQRAVADIGDGRQVFAVSRWNDRRAAERLTALGVRLVRANLLEPADVGRLPIAPNVIYMAGQKFGTTDAPSLTWMTNTVTPALVADRYRGARIVAFSTGNVYALSSVNGHGAQEDDALAPVGEYAASCLGRERVFEYAAQAHHTPISIIRLNYAVDLRYGVLVDIAQKVRDGAPVDVRMGYVNCIWQGDANAFALEALAHCATPPFVLNVTGEERLSVRNVALELGRLLGCEPDLRGTEQGDALLSNTARLQSIFGHPYVGTPQLLEWVADWVGRGGRTLGKATKFESRDGSF